VNAWLVEPKGEQFRDNKWRFWFVALIGFSILNAALTALVFNAGGVLQTYMGSVLVGVGALLAWLGVGALHYSDSTDTHLSRGVAVLDSVTLLFVVAHFSFLMWVYGHLSMLKNAEADYNVAVSTYNAKAEAVQAANEKIAEALAKVSENERQTARIENDTIYQARKAAQAGAKVQTGLSGSLAANISTSKVELSKPPEPPKDASVDYLTRWDSTIRLANFGELALAVFTLIFIRVRSSLTNTPTDEDFPSELDADVVADRRSGARLDRTRQSDRGTTVVHFGESFDRKKARRKLLDHLGVISSYHPGKWFKADLVEGGVHIRMCARVNTIEETIADTRQSDRLLMAVDRPDFRERLIIELRHQGFEI
jgi:hypothetical protein